MKQNKAGKKPTEQKGTWKQDMLDKGYVKIKYKATGGCASCAFRKRDPRACDCRKLTGKPPQCAADDNNGIFGLYYIKVPKGVKL